MRIKKVSKQDVISSTLGEDGYHKKALF